MKEKKANNKINKNIFTLFLSYKNLMIGIFICLMCMSFVSFFQPLIIRKITDDGMAEKNMFIILKYAILLLAISLLYQISDIIQTRLFSNIHNGIYFSLYKQAYWKMSRLKIDYYSENGSTEIVHTISNDIRNIASIANQMTTFSVTSVLQVFGGIIGLGILNWKMAVLIVLLIPIKFIIVYYFSKRKNGITEEMINSSRTFSGWLGDCINGIYEMKLWDLFQVRYEEFHRLQKNVTKSYFDNCMLDKYKQTSVSLLDSVLNVIVYILSGWMIVTGKSSIGSAFAFVTYCGYVVSPISFLVDIKYYYAEIRPSMKRFEKFMELDEEIETEIETDESFLYTEKNMMRNSEIPDLEFCGVWFGYGSDAMVIKNVNLTVYAGEKIAIIGENGSGKTTLLKLLSGFYQPDEGKIKIQGIDINKLGAKKVREKISMVCQKPYLFKGTIEENVNINGKASSDEVAACCEKSGAISFINRLDGGFAQFVGRDGAKLSGGEKQKLAVARALAKNADILILDEATSGIDKESNKELIDLLCKDFKEKTIILVTHRYEELEGIEKVYRLFNGELKLERV